MSNDHPMLVHIWTKLRNNNNVIVVLEADDPKEDIANILEWFQSIIKTVISSEEVEITNGTLLCFRKILKNMPTMDPRAVGDYELVVIDSNTLEQMRNQ